MIGSGTPLETIGKALNQRNLETTRRYAHLELGPVKEGMERAALLMSAAMAAAPSKAPNDDFASE